MSKVLALALLAVTTAHAQEALTDIPARSPASAYLQDGRGIVARSGTGLCWRSGTWTPADAVPGCDGELLPPIANPIAPPLVTAPPAPAAPVPVAPVPCDFSYTLAGDGAFASGQASLNAAARARLDRELMPRLAECGKIAAILVTGHTDRLGKRAANQALSERRAAAVADYLKASGVTAPIERRGAGSTAEVQTCSARQPSAKLRQCLAPNRRVVIEVRGTSK